MAKKKLRADESRATRSGNVVTRTYGNGLVQRLVLDSDQQAKDYIASLNEQEG